MAYERVNWENLPSTKTPINQANLTKMENGIDQAGAEIFAGAEEPTTGGKVWFRKGKNLFNKNVSIITGYSLADDGSIYPDGNSWYQSVFIEVNSKTQYTISSTVALLRICFYDKDRKFISRQATTNTSVTFSTPENCKYVRLSGKYVDTQVQSLQLERGSKATSYEAYIEPKIYVRNSNGVYEEFIKVDNLERINRTLIPTGTEIVANSDLNTINFLKVGKYYCSTNATAASLSNCPTNVGFMMEVFSIVTNKIDDEQTGTWIYRIRRIFSLYGDVYYQQCWSNENKEWTYGNWKQVSMTAV